MAKLLRISYAKSAIGYSKLQKETIRSLGLRKLNSVVLHDDTPIVRGMIFKVQHLVKVEELNEAPPAYEPAPATTHVRPRAAEQAPAQKPQRAAKSRNVPAEPQAASSDDLAAIEGIGPKIATMLNEAGVTTFAELAQTDAERLKAILEQANLHMVAPDTWPEQAALAADGKWEELKALQERLTAGRRSE
jgi:ribosomal protein L30